MHLGKGNPKEKYLMEGEGGEIIDVVHEEKDLGVVRHSR